MTPRRWLGSLAVATALVLAGQDRNLLHASNNIPPIEIVSLPIRLAAWDGLASISTKALRTEAAAIWRRSGIDLHWLTSEAADPSLRVLVSPQAIATHGGRTQWTLGELLRFDDQAAIAVVSIAGAQRIVDQSRQSRVFDVGDQRDYRLGVVLGRAVAHEIGHFLLRTDTHATSGLMRATINAREFADVSSPAFGLDEAAQAHLAHLARVPLSQAPLFSYAAR
jgi:hypothetical protein